MNFFSRFKKNQDNEAPKAPQESSNGKEQEEMPSALDQEEPQEEEEVALGTKLKVVAALAVVGFATYVAYWVQEPTDFKAQVIDPETPAAEEVVESLPTEEVMVAATEDAIVGPTQEVAIIDFTFTPANITVEEGTTVVWTNIDAVDHTVTSDFFTSDVLKPGDSFLYTFEQEGTFEYFCSIHPQMKGKINVSASTTAPVETLPDNNPIVSVDEEAVLSSDVLSLETSADTNFEAVTLDPEEFLQEPPVSNDDTLVLSLPTEAGSHTAASENPDSLAKSGPEDMLYVGLFATILFMNRRRLQIKRVKA